MFHGGTQVLAQRDDGASRIGQVVERCQYLGFGLSEAEHEAAFGHRAARGDVAEYFQRSAVPGPRTYEGRQPLDGLDVVTDDIRCGVDDDVEQLFAAVEIGNEHLDGGVGIYAPDGTNRFGPMAGSSVG